MYLANLYFCFDLTFLHKIKSSQIKNLNPVQSVNFQQAAAALHDENATYPKKIAYAYTAHTSPRLAVEALEVIRD